MPALRAEGTGERAPVRGTQSFVHTLSACWQRPGLTGLEVLWRWAYGVPALWVIGSRLKAILAAHTQGTFELSRLGLDRALLADPVGALTADPMGVVGKVTQAVAVLLPDVVRVAVWLAPVLLVAWVVVSAVGRTSVMRRVDARLSSRPGTLMLLQAIRMAALAGTLALWWVAIQATARLAVSGPMAAGQEPELVLYCALAIVATLGLFTLWAVGSWVFSVAPLLAMLRGLGAGASLRAAFRLGSLKWKLIEINLVMGIVKIALIVLAMVFSASPLPFETVATEGFLVTWWAGVTVLYLVGSDFFHVARLVAYLDLWRAYERE
ncbi:MAG TPA: hypothetical protein VNW54_16055 [Granulicella sp.]|nr:hypothetical protein [Granulicella sp.]